MRMCFRRPFREQAFDLRQGPVPLPRAGRSRVHRVPIGRLHVREIGFKGVDPGRDRLSRRPALD